MPSSADRRSAGRPPEPVSVRLPITLGQFLKLAGLASTGGEAKYLIVSGRVLVNDLGETKRGRHMQAGDTVRVADETVVLVAEPTPETVQTL